MSYELSIIIPVFNKWELTRNCLVSLKEHSSNNYEVIVVDNASSDATETQLEPLGKTLFGEKFTVIRNLKNKNFGPACNQGAKVAKAPLIFFLNNDTIMTPGWLPPLLEAIQNKPDVGAVGPLLLYPDDTVQHLGIAFFLKNVLHLYQSYPRTHPVVAKKRNLQALTGAALMLSKDIFWQCGGFYEGYVNGFEDVDLCLQIYALGKKMHCIPDSVIYHLESQSAGRKAGEDSNASLLRKRCSKTFNLDAHIHAIKDRFTPIINDALELSLLLPEQDNQKLKSESQGKTSEWLHAKVNDNPAWLDGTTMLKIILDEHKQYGAAFHYASLENKRYVSITGTDDLLKRAQQFNDANTISTIQGLKEYLKHLYTGTPSLAEETLRWHLRRALDAGDKVLAKLCEDKLAFARKTRL